VWFNRSAADPPPRGRSRAGHIPTCVYRCPLLPVSSELPEIIQGGC